MADGKLSAAKLRNLSTAGHHGDGGGLYFRIGQGRRSWLFRFKRAGKGHWFGLGPYPDVSLAQAREAARQCREQLRQGTDPLEARRQAARQRREAEGRTFKTVAMDYVEAHAKTWKNAKHADQWRSTLEQYAFPVIGDRPVSAITTDDVIDVLKEPWERVPETASRLRGRLETIFDYARGEGWGPAGENPAAYAGRLKKKLPAVSRAKRIEHQPALPWKQMAAFITALREVPGVSARALEFVILTAARSGEVRGMTWAEVDMAEAVWVIRAERMKSQRQHRVPLSEPALAILRAMHPAPGVPTSDPRLRNELVFPGRGKALSDMSISAVVKRMNGESDPPTWRDAENRAAVPHGFRSSFRVWCSESAGVAREVAESALAHVVKDATEAAYARSDLLERRRPLMDAWARHVAGAKGEVVPFAARA